MLAKKGSQTMTRRRWLAVVSASMASSGRIFADVPFERIDTHVHVNRPSRAIVTALETARWRVLSICDSRATGEEPGDLEPQLRGTEALHRESQGRVAWAGSFDPRGWKEREFQSRTIAALQQQFRDGAIATKIWKNVGMAVRSKGGAYLLPDHPVLDPIYQLLQKEGRTLVAHLAEPNGAWLPLNEHNPERGYYGSHPEWHMYGRPGVPSKEAILEARDRVIIRYPKLRVVGAHLGSNEEDLEALSKRLDRMPNFAVDLAARIRYFAAGNRTQVIAFLTKYQDRVLYGTDFTLRPDGDDQRTAESMLSQHERDYQYFASAEPMSYGRTQVSGLGLPEPILRKIFRENAVRWFPGIA
jgi:hypothetical protein